MSSSDRVPSENHQPQQPDFMEALESPSFFRLNDLPTLPTRHPSGLFGQARLATSTDLIPVLHRPDEEYPFFLADASVLAENERGTRFEQHSKQNLYFPAALRQQHVLVVGQTGSGKTSRVIVPSVVADIKDPSASLVVLDAKGDLYDKIAPFCKRHRGKLPWVLNLLDPGRTTHAWNPFAGNVKDADSLARDVHAFCEAADPRTNWTDSPFWQNGAEREMAAILGCYRKKLGRSPSLADVHHAVELPRRELLKLLENAPEVPFAAGMYSYLKSEGHNAETVHATLQGYLRALLSPQLAAVTSADELQFVDLFRKPNVLVVEVLPSEVERLRPYVNLLFHQLLRGAASFARTQPGCSLPRPLNVFLDDFAVAVGRIPDMGSSLNLLRHADVRIVAAVQSIGQLLHYYGSEADSVLAGFASKIFQPPVEQEDAERACRMSGTTTVVAEEQEILVRRGAEGGSLLREARRSRSAAARSLLLPEDIRLSSVHPLYGRAATLFLPDMPPFPCWLRPAHEVPELAVVMRQVGQQRRARRLRRKRLSWSPPSMCVEHTSDTCPEHLLGERLETLKAQLDWVNTTGSARRWWEAFERENASRLRLVVRTAEELAKRKATVTEFFLAYVYSNTDNIQANLYYLDYTRLKKEEERKKRERTRPKEADPSRKEGRTT
jgi:type IV secretory pathway TraG/TraD family ATPase VirD4